MKLFVIYVVFCFIDEVIVFFNYWYVYVIIYKREVFDELKKIFLLLLKDE